MALENAQIVGGMAVELTLLKTYKGELAAAKQEFASAEKGFKIAGSVGLDSSKVKAELAALEGQMNRLRQQRTMLQVGIDPQAGRELAILNAQLRQLEGRRVSIQTGSAGGGGSLATQGGRQMVAPPSYVAIPSANGGSRFVESRVIGTNGGRMALPAPGQGVDARLVTPEELGGYRRSYAASGGGPTISPIDHPFAAGGGGGGNRVPPGSGPVVAGGSGGRRRPNRANRIRASVGAFPSYQTRRTPRVPTPSRYGKRSTGRIGGESRLTAAAIFTYATTQSLQAAGQIMAANRMAGS